jgi:hypothetical protein
MENKPALDRELFIPVLIGGLSVVGIVVVLMIGRALEAPAQVAVTASATPFSYIYLGTEPALSTPLGGETEAGSALDGSSDPDPAFEPTSNVFPPAVATPVFATPTGASASTPLILPTRNATGTSGVIILITNTPNRISTPTLSSPTAANTYDDTDSRLSYTNGWTSQSGLTGQNAPYQGTLHVSDAVGNTVTFTFTGQEIQLYYQSAPSLGTITVTFDTETLAIPINQAGGNGVWVYMLPTSGTHTATIEHTSGGSVNIDRLVIPAPTATPTRTPTPTP